MMTGGTTTALLSLISAVDQSKYEISLLLYTNTGTRLEELPSYVQLLEPAYQSKRWLSSSKRKIIKTVFNGRIFLSIKAFLKYRKTPNGKFRNILMHYGMSAQVSLSRCVNEEYDYAIGFMEGWASEYVSSNRIKAKKKLLWIHPQYKSCYLIPEIDKKSFRYVDNIVLISENCVGQFLEFFPEYEKKTKVVPNIVSSEFLLEKARKEIVSIKKGKINFCTVCRCDIQVKGLDRLLKAFYELKRQGLCEDVLWHFIGGGGDFELFKTQVARLEMQDVVILYGNQLNPLPYLLQMDAFILASRYEGKPMSVTEAQILGLPCIVTNYESAISQVKHNVNGWIMGNNYDSILESLKKVIQNQELLLEWKENTMLGEYGNEHEIEKFYNVLEE